MDAIEEARKSVSKTSDELKGAKGTRINYVLDMPGVIDVLSDGKKIVYLKADGETAEQIRTEEGVFQPPPKNLLPYLMPEKERVLLYINDGVIGTKEGDLKLYEQVAAYHRAISDLPDDLYYDLLTLWDFHTYLIDKLHFSPMLYFYAVKERGKSRTGKGCIYIARRGVWTETVREADVIRWGNDHKAVLGFDVKDFPKKILKSNCDDLLLARFEAGSTSSRTLWPEKGAFRDTKTFNLFGPTIIATNRPVDDISESRSISINMKPTSRVFNEPVLPEDALDLKAQLTAFRFRHINSELPKIEKPANGRLGDILSPLQVITNSFFPSKMDRFRSLVKIISAQKQDEATDSFEAKIIESVISCRGEVVNGFLSVDSIAKHFNEGRQEKFVISNDSIGKTLKGLGFTLRRNGKQRGIDFDPKIVKKIASQYGIVFEFDTSELASHVSPITLNDDTNDTSDSDVDIPKASKVERNEPLL